MGVISAITVGLLLWIVLWALGYKAIDGFMLTVLIAVVAVGTRMLLPYLPGNRE